MKACIEGFRKVSFTGDTGEPVSGMSVYYMYRDPSGVGLAADSFFVRSGTGVWDFLTGWVSVGRHDCSGGLGINCLLDFNRKGRLLSVDFLDSSGVPYGDPDMIEGGDTDD